MPDLANPSSLIPFVVGLCGNIAPDTDEEAARSMLRAIWSRLDSLYPSSPKILLTGLANDFGRIAAEAVTAWLDVFGAKIEGKPFVHQRARIEIPWHLTLRDRACLGDRANAYSLGEIEIGERATVAQEVYLSTGSHDFSHPALQLVTAKITIGPDAFIGARAFVLPGVEIGARSVIGACSVVTKDVPPDVIAAGNPCSVIRPRA